MDRRVAADAILIGAGSTTHEFARRLQGFRELTVMTNSVPVAGVLAVSDDPVRRTGGRLRDLPLRPIAAAAAEVVVLTDHTKVARRRCATPSPPSRSRTS